jgi:hypothetical protein
MQYFVSVIADGTELAMPGEMAAIGAFNDRLRSMSLDGYVADPNDDVAEVFAWYFSGSVGGAR